MSIADPFESLFQVSLYWLNQKEKMVSTGVNKIIEGIEEEINISFDQSSTQTGICIANNKGEVIGICDVINLGLPDRDMYIRLFRKWLNLNFADIKINYVVCERAEQNAPQQYTKKLLQKLISVLEDFADDHNTQCYQIDNKTWKKWFLRDEKYKGQRVKTELVKVAIVDKAVTLYPCLYYYYRLMRGTDSADAIGIMHGFIDEFFVDGFGSTKKVCTIMPTAPKRKYELTFVTLKEFSEMVSNNPSEYRGLEIVGYNEDMTLEDNARRIINFFSHGAVVTTKSEKVRMLWKYTADKEITQTHIMLVR